MPVPLVPNPLRCYRSFIQRLIWDSVFRLLFSHLRRLQQGRAMSAAHAQRRLAVSASIQAPPDTFILENAELGKEAPCPLSG